MAPGYSENSDGVHVVSPLNGEFMLCGDADDIGPEAPESGDMHETSKRIVTCPKCAAVVRACRGVKISTGGK